MKRSRRLALSTLSISIALTCVSYGIDFYRGFSSDIDDVVCGAERGLYDFTQRNGIVDRLSSLSLYDLGIEMACSRMENQEDSSN